MRTSNQIGKLKARRAGTGAGTDVAFVLGQGTDEHVVESAAYAPEVKHIGVDDGCDM